MTPELAEVVAAFAALPPGDAMREAIIVAVDAARSQPATECSFPAGEGELPYYCEVHGHIRDRLTDSHCRIALAARSQPATEGLREAARALVNGGVFDYTFTPEQQTLIDAFRAALAK